MNNTQRATAMRRLATLAEKRALLEEEIRGIVDMGRAADLDGHCAMSWYQIGCSLGVSKQAAQQRYGR